MRACVQRVTRAAVRIDGRIAGQIDRGMVVLLAVAQQDTGRDAEWMADKVSGLRIFADDQGKMNRSLAEANGAALVVSQFTLLGDCRKGRRPSFVDAADPQLGAELYRQFIMLLKQKSIPTATGVFQANMQVELVNDGPVTLLLDSRRLF